MISSERARTELERLTALAPKLELRRVLIAVSGGLDSVTLLHLMVETGLKLTVAHLDHSIRSESGDDAIFVQKLCVELNLPCELERVNIPEIAAQHGWGLEEAARKVGA